MSQPRPEQMGKVSTQARSRCSATAFQRKGIVFPILGAFLLILSVILGVFVFFVPVLVNGLWIFLDKNRQALHDKMAGTIVVYAPSGLPESLQAAGPAASLRRLKEMLDGGLITSAEYEEKWRVLIDEL